MNKRGQIAVFIILGVVLIAIVGYMVYVSSELKPVNQVPSLNVEPIEMYVSSCLDSSLKEGVLYTGLNETDLNKYLENHFAECSLQTFEEQGFEIQEGRITSNVQTYNKSVNANINYPLKITRGKASARIDGFASLLSLQKTAQITNQEVRVYSDDGILQVIIPANVNATLDDNPISGIQINIISSDNDPNIFSPLIYRLQLC